MNAPPLDRRRAGVLLHPTSLPAGDLGPDAHRFVDWLAESGITVWQMLPLGPPQADRSPYQTDSAHAGNPALISPAPLLAAGWLTAAARAGDDWLVQVADHLASHGDAGFGDAFERYLAVHGHWLDDYARYRVLKNRHAGAPWWRWPPAERDRDPAALAALERNAAAELRRIHVEQFLFETQWQALRDHAHARGVWLFGDVPIFVAHDSAEVWCNPELFTLGPGGTLERVAGVPPDYFSATGQRWGNPLYRWERMAADGFAWWIERLRTELCRFDLLRIDHFRGFAACWAIPAASPTAVDGAWVAAPGQALFGALHDALGELPLVAEDLGVITDDVVALRDGFDLPGMRVLQFAFEGGAGNPYLPHHHVERGVVYTGTHDNDTTLGWWQALDAGLRGRVDDYLGQPREAMPWPLVRAALGSVARLAVVPLQDLLGLDARHRMNTPGTTTGNWGWRFDWTSLADGLSDRVRHLAGLYDRLA